MKNFEKIVDLFLFYFVIIVCKIFDHFELEWIYWIGVAPLVDIYNSESFAQFCSTCEDVWNLILKTLDSFLEYVVIFYCKMFDIFRLGFFLEILTIGFILNCLIYVMFAICSIIDPNICYLINLKIPKFKFPRFISTVSSDCNHTFI